MAQGHHQTITKPRLYTSYPLFLYANGGLDRVRSWISNADNLTDEELLKLITIEPSSQVTLPTNQNNNWLSWRILPSHISYDKINDSNLVFNGDNSYAMVLGHNFNSSDSEVWVSSWDEEIDGDLINENSLEQVTSIKTESEAKIGSFMFGKFFDLPQNAELNTKIEFKYGNKSKSSISGKTISTLNWSKPDNWITEPFGLGDENFDNPFRKNGRRIWSISFSSLLPKYVTSQNMMLNSNGFTAQENHSTGADDVSSLYNAYNSTDFYTNCVKMTMGGHLPMVLCIDQNDTSPSNWAIVRMSKYTITQKTPNLYNFRISLVEQI